jgi:hypothetical protein
MKCIVRGCKLEKSALTVAETEAVSSTDGYLSLKRLRRRKRKLSVVRRMEIGNE